VSGWSWEKKSTHSRGKKVGKHNPMFTLSRGKGGSREKELFIHFHRKMWSYEIESYSLNNRQVEDLKKLSTCSKKENVGKAKRKEWFTFERENGGWREKIETKCLPIPKKEVEDK
jgi:hypothetical protein